MKVLRTGEDVLDLLHDAKRGLRGLKRVRYGYVRVPGVGVVLLERFRAKRRVLGPGSVNVRYDCAAREGETAFQHRAHGERMLTATLAWLQKERGMAFGPPRQASKPHYAREHDPDAAAAARARIRVTTRDPYGEVRMDASHGPEWESDNPKSMAARGRMAGNVEWMKERIGELLEDLRGLGEAMRQGVQGQEQQVGALKDLKGALERLPGAVAEAIQEMAARTARQGDPEAGGASQEEPRSDPGGMFG